MSETRNRYGYPTPTAQHKWDHPNQGQEAIVRTVGELRRYLDGLPGDWRVEGPGLANALRVEAIPSHAAMPALVCFMPITLDRSGGWT